MKPKAVIFDLDGTFYDNRPLFWLIPLSEFFCLKLHYSYRERKARRLIRGEHFATGREFYERFFALISPQHPERAERWYGQHYMPLQVSLLHRFCRLYDWVKPYVGQLRQEGIRVALYSDYGHAAEKLQALGLSPSLFDLIVDAPSLGGLKPSEVSARQLYERLGVDPADTLIIGDREDVDGETARRVGARFQLVGKHLNPSSPHALQ